MDLQTWFQAAKSGTIDYIRENTSIYRGQTTESAQTALMLAVCNFHYRIVEILAPLEYGHVDKEGNTALSLAAFFDDSTSSSILLKWERTIPLSGGITPAMICAQRKGTKALRLLISAYKNVHDDLGRTVLDYAIVSECPETIDIVLDCEHYSSTEVAAVIVRALSDRNTVLTELRNQNDCLIQDRDKAILQLRELETALEAANLGIHNLRCKVRSMEDYTEGIHEILRQLTRLESIDEILTRLTDSAFSDNIAQLLEGRRAHLPISVATSPALNILSCSPLALNGNEKEIERLTELLADRDEKIALLQKAIGSGPSMEDNSESGKYTFQISEQQAQLEQQRQELNVLRHLVGIMAAEAVVGDQQGVPLTKKEQETLDSAREAYQQKLQWVETQTQNTNLATILEGEAVDPITTISKSGLFVGELIEMRDIILKLLQEGSMFRAETMNNTECDAETITTIKLFTETVENAPENQKHSEMSEFKKAFTKLVSKFLELQENKKQSHDHAKEKSSPIESESEDPPIILPVLLKTQAHDTEVLQRSSVSVLREPSPSPNEELPYPSHESTPNLQRSQLDILCPSQNQQVSCSMDCKRIINVREADEELLRCMESSNEVEPVKPISKNSIDLKMDLKMEMDLESVYSKLNGQDRSIKRTHQIKPSTEAEAVTTVSAILSSHGVKIKATRGKSLTVKGL